MLNLVSTKESYRLRLYNRRCKNLTNIFYRYFCFLLFIFVTFFPFTYAVISSSSNSLASNFPLKNNVVEGSGSFPGQFKDEWQASGANPDDEPEDDIEQGSGDVIEGSGTPMKTHEQNLKTVVPKPTMRNKFNIDNKKSSHNFSIYIPTTPIIHHHIETKITTMRSTLKSHIIETTLATRTTITTSKPFVTVATTPKLPPSIKKVPELPPYISEPADSFEMLKPGILAAVSGGAVVGVLLTILLVLFIVYRMRKKDEGSYSLDEPHQPPNYSYAYQKASTKEFYA